MAFASILFPTDMSGSSVRGLACAAEMSRAHNAKLYVLHVVYDPDALDSNGRGDPNLATIRVELGNRVERDLASLCGWKADEISGVVLQVARGQPAREILRFAREKDVDMIVIGSYGSDGRERVKFGSVVDRVVRSAPCPVLTIVQEEASRKGC